MSIVSVPYHQDERLPEDAIPLPSDAVVVVSPELPGESLWDRLGDLYDAVASTVAADIQAGNRPTVVSGDCLVSLGVVTGVQRSGVEPSVIWFDAHGDVHTVASSTSGYWGGLALRMVVGGDYTLVGERLGLRPVPESHVTLVDARDLDPAEAKYLATSEIHRCSVADLTIADGPVVDRVISDGSAVNLAVPDGPAADLAVPDGSAVNLAVPDGSAADRVISDGPAADLAIPDRPVADRAIADGSVADLAIPDGPIVLHVDVDVIDSAEVPGLLFPVPGGPSLSAVLDAIHRIINTGNVVAVDLAFPWHATPEHEEARAELVRALVG